MIAGLVLRAPGVGAAILLTVIIAGALAAIVHLTTTRAAKQAVMRAAHQHMPALVRRRAQLLTVDAYGAIQTDKWIKEVRYFYDSQVSTTLSNRQRKAADKNWDEIVRLVSSAVAAAAVETPAFSGVCVEQLSPIEFETYCADRLREAGWDARTTKGSGDQGVDVVAERAGVRVALQCKLYATPIGNKAVQEVAAGRVHYGAQCAAVVSNRSYTPAAEQLARSNRVLLLHHTQLDGLAEMIGETVRLPPNPSPSEFHRPQPEPFRPAAPGPARSSFGLRR
ncbi:MAG TPA: restriction endonuclease [Rhizomicrobium sp.]